MIRSRWIPRMLAGMTLGALGILMAPGLLGTTWKRLELSDLAKQSEAIAIGTVTSVSVEEITTPAFKDVDGSDMIYTRYELAITESFKGVPKGQTTLSFVSLGGQVGDRSVEVPGAPHFAQGEKVVGFFFRNAVGRLQPFWGGINRIESGRRGEVVIGEPAYTIEQNVKLSDLTATTRQLVPRGN